MADKHRVTVNCMTTQICVPTKYAGDNGKQTILSQRQALVTTCHKQCTLQTA